MTLDSLENRILGLSIIIDWAGSSVAMIVEAVLAQRLFLSLSLQYYGDILEKENWVALGAVLIILALITMVFSNVSSGTENYIPKASVDNSPLGSSNVVISGNFEAGQNFLFNFTKGHFWGVQYDQQNGGLEPADNQFAPNATIPPYKEIYFGLIGPSGYRLEVGVYLDGGVEPYAVVVYNETADFALAQFTPISGRNLTEDNVGIQGITNATGNYTVIAETIAPPVYRALNMTYDVVANPSENVLADPPLQMGLWNVETGETKPYLIPVATMGAILLVSGVGSVVWAVKPSRISRGHLKK